MDYAAPRRGARYGNSGDPSVRFGTPESPNSNSTNRYFYGTTAYTRFGTGGRFATTAFPSASTACGDYWATSGLQISYTLSAASTASRVGSRAPTRKTWACYNSTKRGRGAKATTTYAPNRGGACGANDTLSRRARTTTGAASWHAS